MKNIAIIPAKEHSSRIPKKNFKNFFGKPMIYWSINNAIKSKLFDKVIVLTDSKRIEKIAKKYNAEVPFLRPKRLNRESVGIQDLIRFYIKNSIQKKKPNYICCIFPTAPLIFPSDIIRGYKKIKNKKYQFVFSASNFSHTPLRSFTINEKKEKIDKMLFSKKNFFKSSKMFKKIYHDIGQFYWASPSAWIKKQEIYNNNSAIVKIPHWRAQDIDYKDDWIKVEKIFKTLNKK